MTEGQKARMFEMMTHIFDIVKDKEAAIRQVSKEKDDLQQQVAILREVDQWLSELQGSTQESHEHTAYVRFVEKNIIDEDLKGWLIELMKAVECRFLNRIGEIREYMQISCSDDNLDTLF